MVKYVMEEVDSNYGIDPAVEDNEAIRMAATNGHLDVVKYLIEKVDETYGVDPAAMDNEAIRCAASNGHVDTVSCLMRLDSKYGIDRSIGRQ